MQGKRILLAILLGILCSSTQAKPTRTIQVVQNGIYYVESDREHIVHGVPLVLSDDISLCLQAQKPTAKTGEEEVIWWLVVNLDKAAREVIIRENSDFLTLNLFDETTLKLHPAFDVVGARSSHLIGNTTLIYYYHTIIYAINTEQIEHIINSGVESMQLSYDLDQQGASKDTSDKSFKKDKIGEVLKSMYPLVKSAIDSL